MSKKDNTALQIIEDIKTIVITAEEILSLDIKFKENTQQQYSKVFDKALEKVK